MSPSAPLVFRPLPALAAAEMPRAVRRGFCSFGVALALAAMMTPTAAYSCAPLVVAFPFAGTRIDAVGRSYIAEVAAEIRAQPGVRLRLVAQSDGSRANRGMTRRRAQRVREAFLRLGVPHSRIEIVTRIGGPKTLMGGEDYARSVVLDVVSAPTC